MSKICEVRRALLWELTPEGADDVDAMARDSNVHNWRSQLPVYLYYGRDASARRRK
ncbi:MAG: hypothetical protein KA803_15025 [Rhodoferax sp.]|nr:hypothetical protein [Rhodoferax sp.]